MIVFLYIILICFICAFILGYVHIILHVNQFSSLGISKKVSYFGGWKTSSNFGVSTVFLFSFCCHFMHGYELKSASPRTAMAGYVVKISQTCPELKELQDV